MAGSQAANNTPVAWVDEPEVVFLVIPGADRNVVSLHPQAAKAGVILVEAVVVLSCFVFHALFRNQKISLATGERMLVFHSEGALLQRCETASLLQVLNHRLQPLGRVLVNPAEFFHLPEMIGGARDVVPVT